MNLTLGSLTALRITRAIRNGDVRASFDRRCNMVFPSPAPQKRWSARRIREELSFLGPSGAFSTDRPLDVIVPLKDQRLQVKGVDSTIMSCDLPDGSFVNLGNGVAMSSPELLFIELGRVMDPAVHLLVGMELCGSFSRSSIDPRNGRIAYGIAPITSVDRLYAYARAAHSVYGSQRALETIDLIAENAWSPMEALVAALIVLPIDRLGLGLGPLKLNPRKELGERLSRLSDKESRVPDIMFTGTNVGINYDGEDHFRLEEIARAAVALERDPGSKDRSDELAAAIADARARIVEDKRRDRDLMSLGLMVFSATKEDLLEQGGFERVMGQVVEATERTERRDLSSQRLVLENGRLEKARFNLIRSLSPGAFSGGLGASMADIRMGLDDAVVRFETEEDRVEIVSTVRG